MFSKIVNLTIKYNRIDKLYIFNRRKRKNNYKKATNKNEFLRIVMLYAIGTYEEKLKVYNDLIKKSELLKIKQKTNE